MSVRPLVARVSQISHVHLTRMQYVIDFRFSDVVMTVFTKRLGVGDENRAHMLKVTQHRG